MNDLFRAMYVAYKSDVAAGTPYALTSGRFYRSVAPQETATPYITLNLISGELERIFSAGRIEHPNFQCDIWARHVDVANQNVPMRIYNGLVTLWDNQTLTLSVGEGTSMIVRRMGMPTEEADEEYIHVLSEWYFERLF